MTTVLGPPEVLQHRIEDVASDFDTDLYVTRRECKKLGKPVGQRLSRKALSYAKGREEIAVRRPRRLWRDADIISLVYPRQPNCVVLHDPTYRELGLAVKDCVQEAADGAFEKPVHW